MLSPRNWIFATAIAAAATMSTGSLQAQAAATICKDGTTSVSSGRGACSGHGGVNKKAMKAQKKAAKSEVKAAAKGPAAATPKATAKAKTSANSKSAASGSGAGEDNNPAGAIARCKDGLYSHAKNRRGACSRHGGVASWS